MGRPVVSTTDTDAAPPESTPGRYPDAVSSFVKAVRDIARLERERDEARAERDAALSHLQAVREFAHGLGAFTATRNEILDACTRAPFAPEHGKPGSEPCS